jgi:hypothetical protein
VAIYPIPQPQTGTPTVIVPVVLAPLAATEAPAASTVKQLAALGVG